MTGHFLSELSLIICVLFLVRIYVELADQYKLMDSASNPAKRNVLAAHLKEVIDTLEQKVSFDGRSRLALCCCFATTRLFADVDLL